MLQEALIIGISTAILTEVSKRIPSIPVDPTNKNQIKFVAAVLSLLFAVIGAWKMGLLASFDFRTSLQGILELWVMGWFGSYLAYQSVPYVKGDAKAPETE